MLSFYRTRSVDETGHFLIRGIRLGSYRIYAFDEMAPEAYQDPEFLKPFENEGEALTLEEGQTVKVNPKLLQTGASHEVGSGGRRGGNHGPERTGLP